MPDTEKYNIFCPYKSNQKLTPPQIRGIEITLGCKVSESYRPPFWLYILKRQKDPFAQPHTSRFLAEKGLVPLI